MAQWKALRFMLISTLAFTIMNALVKYLESFHPYQITFFRAFGSLVFSLGFLLHNRIPILGKKRKLLVARGIIGTVAMMTFFLALQELPFGSAISLRYISPIFAAILATFLLKERITFIQWCCFGVAFIGVLLLKGFDGRITPLGLTYIITSALFTGLVFNIIRKIGTAEHPIVIVNYFMSCAVLISGIIMLPYWKTPTGIIWLPIISLGILGFIGQVFMTKAYQIAAVSRVAPIKYIETVFALSLGYFWLGETYSFWSFVGIVLVVGGMLLNLMVKEKVT